MGLLEYDLIGMDRMVELGEQLGGQVRALGADALVVVDELLRVRVRVRVRQRVK